MTDRQTDRRTDGRTELRSQRPCNAERRTVKIVGQDTQTVKRLIKIVFLRHSDISTTTNSGNTRFLQRDVTPISWRM